MGTRQMAPKTPPPTVRQMNSNSALNDGLDLRYSKEPPVVEGWYWCKKVDGSEGVEMVAKRPGHEYLAVLDEWPISGKRQFWAVKKLDWQWAGPVNSPKQI